MRTRSRDAGSAGRFDPASGEAAAWLFGIAHHPLARSRERGPVENQARVRLGLPPPALDDELIARIEAALVWPREPGRVATKLPLEVVAVPTTMLPSGSAQSGFTNASSSSVPLVAVPEIVVVAAEVDTMLGAGRAPPRGSWSSLFPRQDQREADPQLRPPSAASSGSLLVAGSSFRPEQRWL